MQIMGLLTVLTCRGKLIGQNYVFIFSANKITVTDRHSIMHT